MTKTHLPPRIQWLFGLLEQGKSMNRLCLGALFGLAIAAQAHAGGMSVVYRFHGGRDGARPVAPLINIAGTLYGVTAQGGGCSAVSTGCGTIYSLTPAGTETILHRFHDDSDGADPCCIVKAGSGIAGISLDGPNGSTVLWTLSASGTFKVLGTLPANQANGWTDTGQPLTQVGAALYGVVTGTVTTGCGTGSCGYIFAVP